MSTTEIPTSIRSDSTDCLRHLLETAWAFVPARVLSCAIESGVFHLFGTAGNVKIRVDEVSRHTGWASRATGVVLKLLAQAGIVELLEDDTYVALTPHGRKWFHPTSDYNFALYFRRQNKLEAAFSDLATILRKDTPSRSMGMETRAAFGLDRSATEEFLLTMSAAVLEFGPDVILVLSTCILPKTRLKVLDVGCGRGILSILFSEAYPTAKIDAFDLEGVSEYAKAFITERSKQEHISVFAADWKNWAWGPSSYDVVLLSQVLHEFRSLEAEGLFLKAVSTLNRKGLLIIVIVGDATVPGGDLLHRIFAMNMLVETGGDNPSDKWLRKMEAIAQIRRLRFQSVGAGRSLWIGEKLQ